MEDLPRLKTDVTDNAKRVIQGYVTRGATLWPNWVEVDESGLKWMKRDENGWKWIKVDEN